MVNNAVLAIAGAEDGLISPAFGGGPFAAVFPFGLGGGAFAPAFAVGFPPAGFAPVFSPVFFAAGAAFAAGLRSSVCFLVTSASSAMKREKGHGSFRLTTSPY